MQQSAATKISGRREHYGVLHKLIKVETGVIVVGISPRSIAAKTVAAEEVRALALLRGRARLKTVTSFRGILFLLIIRIVQRLI